MPWVLRGEVSESSPLESLLKRDRVIVVAGLVVVVALAWA
jgi:predicted metal-binding membrane protein